MLQLVRMLKRLGRGELRLWRGGKVQSAPQPQRCAGDSGGVAVQVTGGFSKQSDSAQEGQAGSR